MLIKVFFQTFDEYISADNMIVQGANPYLFSYKFLKTIPSPARSYLIHITWISQDQYV